MLQQSTGSSHAFTVHAVISVANKRQSREIMFRISSSSCRRSIIIRNSFNNNNNRNPYVDKNKEVSKTSTGHVFQDKFPSVITLLCIFPARLGIQTNSIFSSRNGASIRIMVTSPERGINKTKEDVFIRLIAILWNKVDRQQRQIPPSVSELCRFAGWETSC
jgi:hypothetical protein